MDIMKKLEILTAGAKYDAACTSSGADRGAKRGDSNSIGNTLKAGCCHAFAADGRCITLLKVLMTNDCIYDCKYCVNRKSNDVARASFTPDELADLTIQFYRRNYIEGLFLSSGVLKSPDYTMGLMIDALEIIRNKYHFNGYIHAKTIPGSSPEMVRHLGMVADRISVNIELPSEESLKKLAPNKTRKAIFEPMGQITKELLTSSNGGRLAITDSSGASSGMSGSIGGGMNGVIDSGMNGVIDSGMNGGEIVKHEATRGFKLYSPAGNSKGRFVPAGQATQMIIGASPETDYRIITLASALYGKYRLKRVFYSAYIPAVDDSLLPAIDSKPPLLREHRLYQADWLMRFYEFAADEILSEENHSFNPYLDPKCNWAVNNMHFFPVNVNKAPLSELLRVPGIGPTSAKRIIQSRLHCKLGTDELKRLGVVLKRARYFIETADTQSGGTPWYRANKEQAARALIDPGAYYFGYEQLSLFTPDAALLPNFGTPEKRIESGVEETVFALTKKLG